MIDATEAVANDEAWINLFARIALRPHLGVTMQVRRGMARGSAELELTLAVTDIHTGKPSSVHKVVPLPSFGRCDERRALDIARSAAREAFEHEIDECLLLDGVQHVDPHITVNAFVRLTCAECGEVSHRIEAVDRDDRGRPRVRRARCVAGHEWRLT